MKATSINVGDWVWVKKNKADLLQVIGFLDDEKVICRKISTGKVLVKAYPIKELSSFSKKIHELA